MASEPHFSGLHQAAATSIYDETNVEQAKSPYFLCFCLGSRSPRHGKPERTPQESASTQGRIPAVNEPDNTGASCHTDFEGDEIANCLYQTAARQPFVSPEPVKRLHFDSSGLAGVFSFRVEEWMYGNGKGKVVVQDVASEDNGTARSTTGSFASSETRSMASQIAKANW